MSLAPSLEWESLNLSDTVLKTIREQFKFKCMTPIQVNRRETVKINDFLNYYILYQIDNIYIYFF